MLKNTRGTRKTLENVEKHKRIQKNTIECLKHKRKVRNTREC